MICFQKKRIQILKITDYVLIIFSKVCSNPHRMLSTLYPVSYGLCSIMRDRKRIHCQIINLKRLIFVYLTKNPFRHFSKIHVR